MWIDRWEVFHKISSLWDTLRPYRLHHKIGWMVKTGWNLKLSHSDGFFHVFPRESICATVICVCYLDVCCFICLYVGSPQNPNLQKPPDYDVIWWSELVKKARWLDVRSGVCRFTVREKVATFRKSSIIGWAWLVSAPPEKDWNKVFVRIWFESFLVFGSTYYILATRLCEYMSFESSFSWGVYLCFSFFAALGIEQNFLFDKGYQLFCSDWFFPRLPPWNWEWSL